MPKDLGDLFEHFKALPEKLEQNAQMALEMAATEMVAEAKTDHDYRDHSGVLTNSIGHEAASGALFKGNLAITVSAGATYAFWVGKGTKPHKIRPKHRKRLRFANPAGGWVFAKEVNHPGTKATRFIENAVEKVMPRLSNELLPDAVELSFAQCGITRD